MTFSWTVKTNNSRRHGCGHNRARRRQVPDAVLCLHGRETMLSPQASPVAMSAAAGVTVAGAGVFEVQVTSEGMSLVTGGI